MLLVGGLCRFVVGGLCRGPALNDFLLVNVRLLGNKLFSIACEGPVWPSRLARSLLPSVMTACCNSVIKVANGRRRLCSYCRTFHEEKRWDTSCCLGLGVFVSTETAARSF